MKKAIVLGAGGFIGNHLVKRLKKEGLFVIGVDLNLPAYSRSLADEFLIGDLRNAAFVERIIPDETDELYQLAADMGGAGYIFSGEHDADIMHNSLQINLNVAKISVQKKVKSLFYASSACVYPVHNQQDPDNPRCDEDSAYPAAPDSEYGWEKLFSERLFLAYQKNYGLNVKIARFHNVYGSECAWNDEKTKAPAALCKKVAQASENGEIEIWGDGLQTRSFLHIEDCLDGIRSMMNSNYTGPVNIGSEEMIGINDFARLIAGISGKRIMIKNITGPVGVRGRSSDNRLSSQLLDWRPQIELKEGITLLYEWIEKEVSEFAKIS